MKNPFDPGFYTSTQLRDFGFAGVGDNVAIAKNCTIIGLANIVIGDNVRIDSKTEMFAATGSIAIGSNVHIGSACHLTGRGCIELADFSGLSQGVKIYSASDDYSGEHMTNPTVAPEYTCAKVAPVRLGRHAIIGSGSVILPGCDVPEGCAVGALSLVATPLDPWGIYAGSPATRRRDRSRRLLQLEAEFLGIAQAA